jgi:hypothetical protein
VCITDDAIRDHPTHTSRATPRKFITGAVETRGAKSHVWKQTTKIYQLPADYFISWLTGMVFKLYSQSIRTYLQSITYYTWDILSIALIKFNIRRVSVYKYEADRTPSCLVLLLLTFMGWYGTRRPIHCDHCSSFLLHLSYRKSWPSGLIFLRIREVQNSILGPGDRLSWLRFLVVFLSTSRWMLGWYLTIRPRIRPAKSFPIHHHSLTILSSVLHILVTEKAMVRK